MKNSIFFKIVFLAFLCFFAADILAQCPMCKMAAESNLNNGGTDGAGLNQGILYIFVLPYLIVGVMGYLWWKNRRKGVDDLQKAEPDIHEFSSN